MNPLLRDVTNLPTKKKDFSNPECKRFNPNELHDEATGVSKRVRLEIESGQNRCGGSKTGDPTRPPVDRSGRDGLSPDCNAAVDSTSKDIVPESISVKGGTTCSSSTTHPTLNEVGDDKIVSHSVSRDVDLVGTDCGIGKVELPFFPNCSSFELNRCSDHQDGVGSNHSGNVETKKSCSCSFCVKAAYILSDLHYQDMKGRLTALKKSQKEASILVSKYAKEKKSQVLNVLDPYASKLEADLEDQWTVLFQHMEDIFSRETLQLQSNFTELNGLRDHCKAQLERLTGPQ